MGFSPESYIVMTMCRLRKREIYNQRSLRLPDSQISERVLLAMFIDKYFFQQVKEALLFFQELFY